MWMRLQESQGGFGRQGVGWLVLGIDINRDYLAIATLTPSLRTLWSFTDYYLGRLQGSYLTRPLIKQTNKLGPLRGLLPFQLMGPLKLSVIVGNGVRVPTWAMAMLVPLPPRLRRCVRRRRGHVRRWRRVTIRYLITSLSPYIRQNNALLVTVLEDLRGMARRRGLSEIEYSRIWKYALGSNLEKPLINKNHYRILIGRSGSIVIAIDPRDTSNMCFLHNAEGREVKVEELDNRAVKCVLNDERELTINRDINASLNIAIEGLRAFTWHHREITAIWQELTKPSRPGDWARAPREIEGRGLGGGLLPHPQAPMNPTPK